MLYACSILYKTKLPFIVAFNKVDVMPHDFLVEWMQDITSLILLRRPRSSDLWLLRLSCMFAFFRETEIGVEIEVEAPLLPQSIGKGCLLVSALGCADGLGSSDACARTLVRFGLAQARWHRDLCWRL